MKYFAKFKDGCQPKNKAQEKALSFGKVGNATLLGSDAALDKFVEKLRMGIESINRQHTRCSDISVTKNHRGHMNEIYFHAGDIFSYNFYPVLQEFHIEEPAAAPAADKPETTFKF